MQRMCNCNFITCIGHERYLFKWGSDRQLKGLKKLNSGVAMIHQAEVRLLTPVLSLDRGVQDAGVKLLLILPPV